MVECEKTKIVGLLFDSNFACFFGVFFFFVVFSFVVFSSLFEPERDQPTCFIIITDIKVSFPTDFQLIMTSHDKTEKALYKEKG